jgi:four helix bundle protein
MSVKLETGNSKLAAADRAAVRDFTDLETWKLARELRMNIYDLVRSFPSDEKHILIAQIRRAAISVTANIAEGFGRFSYRENLQYCRQARGSAYEVRDHLYAALDAGYINREAWNRLDALAQRAIKVLNGYIRSTRLRLASSQQVNKAEK